MSVPSFHHFESLQRALSDHAQAHGEKLLGRVLAASKSLQSWLEYLQFSVTNEETKPLLQGVRSSLIEVAACTSLGLVRPATVLMRTEIELYACVDVL